ncbi:hypothetical protein BN173_1950010 [Clostridioides difficile T11]|nr:hypothetical protein BN173_1950010 [Clostridioides difficile T11]CCL30217.1 hypothetical protein BN174_1840010 [Clostridioides difficile E15]CCL37986.1 hypothetical protein BN176_1760010 [Clostridioides difficile E19]
MRKDFLQHIFRKNWTMFYITIYLYNKKENYDNVYYKKIFKGIKKYLDKNYEVSLWWILLSQIMKYKNLIGERLCGYTNHQKHNSIDLVLEL